ncbi:hypothetical protein EON66_06085 [archaeon]|nr:MAG: hypothetical protein EON66_06085 [archaeon]
MSTSSLLTAACVLAPAVRGGLIHRPTRAEQNALPPPPTLPPPTRGTQTYAHVLLHCGTSAAATARSASACDLQPAHACTQFRGEAVAGRRGASRPQKKGGRTFISAHVANPLAGAASSHLVARTAVVTKARYYAQLLCDKRVRARRILRRQTPCRLVRLHLVSTAVLRSATDVAAAVEAGCFLPACHAAAPGLQCAQ